MVVEHAFNFSYRIYNGYFGRVFDPRYRYRPPDRQRSQEAQRCTLWALHKR
jgi:hypothetical protein